MIKKTNRVLSLAMSAALMLTNMITPMTVYAEDLTEAALEEYAPDEQLETAPDPETVVPEYLITLPWYEDITYMVDEGRIYRPENMLPEDKDILLKYKADEKVDFAFTPAEGITVTELHLRDDKKDETFFEVDEYGHVSFLMPDKDLIFTLAYEKYVPEDQAQFLFAVFAQGQGQADRPGEEPDRKRGGERRRVNKLHPLAQAAILRVQIRPNLAKQGAFLTGDRDRALEDHPSKAKMPDDFPTHDRAETGKP